MTALEIALSMDVEDVSKAIRAFTAIQESNMKDGIITLGTMTKEGLDTLIAFLEAAEAEGSDSTNNV